MRYVFLISYLLSGYFSNCQSRKIDSAAIIEWPRHSDQISISDDGRYFTHVIRNKPQGKNTFIVQATDNAWKFEHIGVTENFFSSKSDELIFQSKDTLYSLLLGSHTPRVVSPIASLKRPKLNSGTWFAYLQKGLEKKLKLVNTLSHLQSEYDNISNYVFNDEGTVLFLETKYGDTTKLLLVYLNNLKCQKIFAGIGQVIGPVSIDSSGKKIAFVVRSNAIRKGLIDENAIWYFDSEMELATMKVDNKTLGMDGYRVLPNVDLRSNDQYIFFSIQEDKPAEMIKKSLDKVNIWNYKDPYLQSFQIRNPSNTTPRTGTIECATRASLLSGKIVQLNKDGETILHKGKVLNNRVLVMRDNSKSIGDRFWINEYHNKLRLVDLGDGSEIELPFEGRLFSYVSPTGRFIVVYLCKDEAYYSYEIENKKLRKISIGVPAGYMGKINDVYGRKNGDSYFPLPVAGWLPDDKGLIVHDNFDLWSLDMTGHKQAVCLTNGYGRKNNIKFYFLNSDNNNVMTYQAIILGAFEIKTKYNGFFRANAFKKEDPQKLELGPYTYYYWNSLELSHANDGIPPLKAKHSETWVIQRQSYDQAHNYYLTKDFKEFIRLTDFRANEKYRWIHNDLINFKQLDGTISQGVLYKPNDFDSTKKYPLIFIYYSDYSHEVFKYPTPGFFGSGFLNIPWLVSRNYLVFTPDIYFTKYESGPSASNSVIGAAIYLSGFKFVDKKRMAISGHSFGGGLTNYLLTHSNIFAAVFEGAGISDYVSSHLQLGGSGGTRLTIKGRELLSSKVYSWMKESPILNLNNVTSPVLMFHCRPDGAVPWEQAVELFVGLRALNKKAWLIEYDDGDHGVYGKNSEDLTKRVTQYFDHYLKNSPAPTWMTRGIPARLKGIETGYAYDPAGNCGKDCKVCKTWNEKFAKDSTEAMKEIERRKVEEHWQ